MMETKAIVLDSQIQIIRLDPQGMGATRKSAQNCEATSKRPTERRTSNKKWPSNAVPLIMLTATLFAMCGNQNSVDKRNTSSGNHKPKG